MLHLKDKGATGKKWFTLGEKQSIKGLPRHLPKNSASDFRGASEMEKR